MDTSAGRTRGRIVGSEEMNPATMPQGGYVPRGGFMQHGRGGGRPRDLRKVECYTCHKKGHLSCNCPQHTWNQQPRRNNWNQQSQGQEAIVDDRSVIEEEPATDTRSSTQTPQQSADIWLTGYFPIKAALRCHEGDDLEDSGSCKQRLLAFFRCSLAPYVICCNHDDGNDGGGHPANADSSCMIH